MGSSVFTINAPPGTDIWRKPPHTDDYNAPSHAPPGAASASGPLSTFSSARVSFTFTPVELYDQGGLVLELRPADAASSPKPPKWIKTGVEFYQDKLQLSTVACDAWADWSVTERLAADGDAWTTIEVVREGDDNAYRTIWVYRIVKGPDGQETKVPLRELCFIGAPDMKDWQLTVLAGAARPEKKTDKELEVQFRDFEVKWT